MSCLDPKVEHVATIVCPLMDPDFPKHFPKTRKTYQYQKPFEKRIAKDLYGNMIFKK